MLAAFSRPSGFDPAVVPNVSPRLREYPVYYIQQFIADHEVFAYRVLDVVKRLIFGPALRPTPGQTRA